MADSEAHGFTLLEVLIALVIAMLALGALFSGALAGLRSTQISSHYQQALSRAKSHLAAIGRSGAMVGGEQSGDDGGGYVWRVRITPLASATLAGGDAARTVLYDVVVAICWSMDGTDRTVTLQSRRVALTGANPP